MNAQTDNKIASVGKLVTYQMSATVVTVSGKVRKALRPDDIELEDEQLSYSEESLILGSAGADPLFGGQLLDCEVGTVKSFEYVYPDYDPDNLVTLPVDFLVSNGIPANKLQIGYILNRDLLRGKVTMAGNAIELEIVQITKVGDRQFAVLDSNDPLRGLTIRYDIEVLDIRDPTPEEVAAETL